MRWDDLGLPQDNGSSDKQDSVRLAGILNVFEWPQKVDMTKYIIQANTPIPLRDEPGKTISFPDIVYVRHPMEYKYDFSRDQEICFYAGMKKQGHGDLLNEDYINGKDYLDPAVTGHNKRCKGQSANWWNDLWLSGEMRINARYTPLGEPNQILCMAKFAGGAWCKKYRDLNPQWKEAVRLYWAKSYRNEPELAEWIINIFEVS